MSDYELRKDIDAIKSQVTSLELDPTQSETSDELTKLRDELIEYVEGNIEDISEKIENHTHDGGTASIDEEEWNEPTWNTNYINISSSTHLRLYRIGKLCTLKYYFATKTGGEIPTSSVNIVTNIPTAFRPKFSPHQETLLNTSAKRFLMNVDGSNLKIMTYEASATGGTFTGSISYECLGEGVAPTLTCSAPSTAYVNDSLTITGALTYNDTGISGATIELYDDDVLVDGNLVTDSEGEISKTITVSEGAHNYKFVFNGNADYVYSESEVASVIVSKRPSTISLSATSGSIYVGDTPQITGTLSVGSGQSVKIYQGSTLLDTVTTGTGGAFSFTGSATTSPTSLTYHAVFEGDTEYASVVSSDVTITVTKKATALTCNANSTAYVGDSLTISGALTYNLTGINGASIELYDGDTLVDDTLTTSSDGSVSKTVTASEGTHSYKFVFDGDDYYVNAESESVTVVVSKRTSTISLSATSSSIYVGDTPSLSGTLSAGGGQSVSIYQGNTLIDTVTTTTGGVFSYTGSATSSSGSLTYKAVFDGTSEYSGVTSSNVTITVSKKTPTLTASASTSTPSLSSSFTISGTLKDSSSNINNASITISLNGSTVATPTTSSGAYSSSITAPSVAGSYTYTISYGGNAMYNSVSKTVTVNVGKVSTTTTLSTSSASVDVGDTFILSGTFKAGNTGLAGYTVEIYEIYDGLIDAVTTGSNGAFSLTVDSSDFGEGSFTFYAQSWGDATYDDSASGDVAVTIYPQSSVGDIVLTSTKDILSAYDSDTATITATVYDDSGNYTPMVNKDVTFSDGVNTSTVYTNNIGEATFTYSATGRGDVTVSATSSSMTVTYDILDGLFYDDQSSNKTSVYVDRVGTISKTYVANEYIQATGSNNSFNFMGMPIELSTSDNWCIEADVMQTDNSSRIFLGMGLLSKSNSSNYISHLVYGNEYASYGYGTPNEYLFRDTTFTGSINTWYHLKWELIDGILRYSVYNSSGTLLKTKSVSLPSVYSNSAVYPCIALYETTQTRRIKNILIKSYTPFNISANNEILSYADSTQQNPQTSTITATLSSSGLTVQLYDNETDSLVGTMTDNDDGTYSYTYTSAGSGVKTFYAKKGNNISHLCTITDAKYYASNSRINDEGFVYNNDRYLFYSTYQVAVNDEIHFRFKTAPTQALVGIATWSPGSNQFLIQKTTSGQYNLIKNRNGDKSNVSATQHGFYTTQDLIIKPLTSGAYNRANIYQGSTSTLQNWWEFKLNNGNIRVDKYFNYDYEIEVFVL